MGIAKKFNYSSTGVSTIKLRPTHDQTFTKLKGSESVNNLTDLSLYPPMIYGNCIRRLTHQAISMRYHYPQYRIICFKWDFKSAYRRVHYHYLAAVMCIVSLGGYLWMWLRLSFGGSGNPPSWCAVSEIIADLIMSLLNDPSWNPFESTFINADDIPSTGYLSEDIPLAQAQPTMVLPPPRPYGSVDMFVDDGIGLVIDMPNFVTRAFATALLVMDTVSRSLDPRETTLRSKFTEEQKTIVEGAPNEVHLVLGWTMNFRTLTMSLPIEKFAAWSLDIKHILKSNKITKPLLESTIGRLSHAATVIPLGRFFLGRFYAKRRVSGASLPRD